MTADNAPFEGIPQEGLLFLRDLGVNNSRDWFAAHKNDYQTSLLSPLIRLAAAIGPVMADLDPAFETRPIQGKTISKIHRDIRFSADKSPFRTSMWLTYKRPRRDWMDAPAFFFEIASDRHRYGMGFYSASRATMDALREKLNERPEAFRRALTPFWGQGVFVVEGEMYKRRLPGCRCEDFEELYQRKNLYVVRNAATNDAVGRRAFLAELVSGFTMLAPLYDLLAASEKPSP
jgi:uncharacterized protein (TIGR02453 family)